MRGKKMLSCCLSAVWIAVLGSTFTTAEPANRVTLPDPPEIKTPAITEQTIKKLRSVTTRASMVNSLLANPTTRNLVTEVAKKRGVAADNIASLATQPLPQSTSEISQEAAIDNELMNLGWRDGIKFTVLSIPTYASGKYNVGAMQVSCSTVYSYNGDLVRLTPPQVQQNALTDFYPVLLEMELPVGPATYIICYKVTDANGQCPMGLTQLNTSAYIFGRIYLYRNGKSYADLVQINLVPMNDNSGYVGIATLDPDMGHAAPPDRKMRRKNTTIQLQYYAGWSAPVLLFGGIVVTRL